MIVKRGRFASCAGYITFNTHADHKCLAIAIYHFVYTYASIIDYGTVFFILYSIHPIQLQKIVHGPCLPRPALEVQCLTRVCGSTPDD